MINTSSGFRIFIGAVVALLLGLYLCYSQTVKGWFCNYHTQWDTIRKTVTDTQYFSHWDTTFYRQKLPDKIDTSKVLDSYFAHHTAITGFKDSLVDISVRTNFEAGRLWVDTLRYTLTRPLLRPVQKEQNWFIGLQMGVRANDLVLSPLVSYQKKNWLIGAGIDLVGQQKAFTVSLQWGF